MFWGVTSRTMLRDEAHAFLQAGAKTVVGSAWPVPDSVAANTTRAFYELLADLGPIAALNRARRQVQAQTPSALAQSFKILGWD